MARAFVIRPFGKKKDSNGREVDFEAVHAALIGPALKDAKLEGSTTGEIIDAGNIREDMFSLILEADLVVADISLLNANVFYELGIRHALRRKHTVLIRDRDAADSPPFDILTDRYLKYTLGPDEATKRSLQQLVDMINSTLSSDRPTDSPVFKMLPSLPEADVSSVSVVPVDFEEEVQRARDSKSPGWLRLLAQDVHGRRFEWSGLALIGNAQWALKDYSGARDTWESVRATWPDDLAANLALANVYERLSRELPAQKDNLLILSDQAIERVLKNPEIGSDQRVEALALQGRNKKTRWKADYAGGKTVGERRSAAMNRLLRESFKAYRGAFRENLNHFYSGVAALQMGTIFHELSSEGEAWKNSFEDNDEAEEYRRKLGQDLARLLPIVSASVEGALLRLAESANDRPWAEVSKVDNLFLTTDNADRVITAYRDALKARPPFVRDAASGQLQIFADLGIRAGVAEAAVRMIEELETPPPSLPGPAAPAPKPPLAVVFAGHRVDAPDRPQPRFPGSMAAPVRSALVEALRRLGAEHGLLGLASGASGGDILFHEACLELGYRSVLCLPFRADRYAAQEFANLNDWRSRFLSLRDKRDVWELSDQEPLPRWLRGSDVDPWERGNRWVLQMARTSAPRVALLALWDGNRVTGTRGGTFHMVRLAEEAGTVDINVLDWAALKPPNA
jgi:hypothetical protein